MAANISKLAIEYDIECAMPRISVGNSSDVMVHGIVSKPIIDEHTYNSKHKTGTQLAVVDPKLNETNELILVIKQGSD